METPKPGSWIKKTDAPKRPFVLRPHLTTRPLADNPELVKLRKQIKKDVTK